MMENFLLGLFRAEFLTNWLLFRGGVGVSYLEDGDRAADLGSNPGGVVPWFRPNATGLSRCNSGFDTGMAGADVPCAGTDAAGLGTPAWLLSGLGPRAVLC